MSISQKDVEKIAALARITLAGEEKYKFENELSNILEFVEELRKVDTSTVEPMTGGTDLRNKTREDRQVSSLLENRQKDIMVQVPERAREWAKVKSVFN